MIILSFLSQLHSKNLILLRHYPVTCRSAGASIIV